MDYERRKTDRSRNYRIKDIFDFMEAMNPEENPDYAALIKKLGLDQKQLAQAANFTNDKYPDVEMEHEVLDEDDIRAGEPSQINVKIQRQLEEDEQFDPTVHAPFYPARKLESWWLVVADEATRSVLGIKRVTVGKTFQGKVEFIVPTAGKHDLKLFLMSDSYIGVDQEREFLVEAAEGMDVDEDDDDEEDEE